MDLVAKACLSPIIFLKIKVKTGIFNLNLAKQTAKSITNALIYNAMISKFCF